MFVQCIAARGSANGKGLALGGAVVSVVALGDPSVPRCRKTGLRVRGHRGLGLGLVRGEPCFGCSVLLFQTLGVWDAAGVNLQLLGLLQRADC